MINISAFGFKEILSLITGLINGYEKEKEKILEKHIDPLYEKMLHIHNNYLSGFQEIQLSLKDKSKSINDIIYIAKTQRRKEAALRNVASTISIEIEAAERRLVRVKTWDEIKAFTISIGEYLNTNNINGSLYTGFIDTLDKKIIIEFEMHDGVDKKYYEINESYRSELMQQVEYILDYELPNKLSLINSHYAKLRMLLQ